MGTYIKPTSDIFFRYLFGSEENNKLLLSFINSVMEDVNFPKLYSVKIKNPFNLKTIVLEKGMQKDKLEIAKKMKIEGDDNEKIARITGLSIGEIERL